MKTTNTEVNNKMCLKGSMAKNISHSKTSCYERKSKFLPIHSQPSKINLIIIEKKN